MTDTDRIAQMAREAECLDASGDIFICDAEALARFARLVAEDCAGIVDSADAPDGWSNSHISDAIRARYSKEVRCAECNYQHGHAIGCVNNPVDIALSRLATPPGDA